MGERSIKEGFLEKDDVGTGRGILCTEVEMQALESAYPGWKSISIPLLAM